MMITNNCIIQIFIIIKKKGLCFSMAPLNLGGSVTPGPNSGTDVTVPVPGAQLLKVHHVVCRGVRVNSAIPSSP